MAIAMASFIGNLEKLFAQERQYDKLALMQAETGTQRNIFVNLEPSGKRSQKILAKNYFTQESFKTTFGVDFEEVLMNYFKIYAEKHGLDASFDDNLVSLIMLMKMLIKNRDKDADIFTIKDEFAAVCDTPQAQHLKKQETNPFIALEVGPGFHTPHEPTYTYVGITNFVFSRRGCEYKIFFRY